MTRRGSSGSWKSTIDEMREVWFAGVRLAEETSYGGAGVRAGEYHELARRFDELAERFKREEGER